MLFPINTAFKPYSCRENRAPDDDMLNLPYTTWSKGKIDTVRMLWETKLYSPDVLAEMVVGALKHLQAGFAVELFTELKDDFVAPRVKEHIKKGQVILDGYPSSQSRARGY